MIEWDRSLWASGALEGLTWIVEVGELSDDSDSSGIDSETENDMFDEIRRKKWEKDEEEESSSDEEKKEKDVTKEEAKALWDKKFRAFKHHANQYEFVLTTWT